MEEEKASAYYDELTRKGEGAARFKQGLGFSSNDAIPFRGGSSSSFLTSFVRASSPSKTTQFEKQAQLQNIQNKLKKKPKHDNDNSLPSRRKTSRDKDKHREREREKEKHSRRSVSPRDRRSDNIRKDRAATVDYSKLIQGYENMTRAERVKAKMKLQLSESARKDERKGMGSGWERFDFDKDAPLDDEEIEDRKVPLSADTDTQLTASAVEDDGALVNHIGKSFRFSAVETRREEQIEAAHDEAIFGAPSLLPLPSSTESDDEAEADNGKKDHSEVAPATSLISGQALAMQQGSWRDRARRS